MGFGWVWRGLGWVRGGHGRTFARGGATVVCEVGAVFPLVVLGAVAVVVGGQVEAGRAILTRVEQAVIDIQLGEVGRQGGEKEGRVIERRSAANSIADTVSATLNRAKPTASSQQARARKQHTHSTQGGREGGGGQET